MFYQKKNKNVKRKKSAWEACASDAEGETRAEFKGALKVSSWANGIALWFAPI